MDAFLIDGRCRLRGQVSVSGSKNTCLPLLFSALLFDEPVVFENVPRLWDIETTLQLLESIGSSVVWNKNFGEVAVQPSIKTPVAPYDFVKKMRAGILALGPLVAKRGEAKVSLPGGCAIGARPVDFHLNALKAMGASITVAEGYIKAQVSKRLHGARITFPQITVTGTENILMAAALADGETKIENAAIEPEVTSVAEFLRSCGVPIEGIGTHTLLVQGGKLQTPKGKIRIPSDRIECGTWIAAAVSTGSELEILNSPVQELSSILHACRQMGVEYEANEAEQFLRILPSNKLEAIEIETKPYPGFPTDMQAQMMVMMTQATGTSRIKESIFENRFMHVAELRRLGADITVEHNVAIIKGKTPLIGAPLMATDLRASASLVVAALCAEGKTTVSRIYHLDRGYQKLDLKLKALGVHVERIQE